MSKTSIDWIPGSRLNDCRTSGDTMGTRYTARFLAPEGSDVKRIVAELDVAVTAVDDQMSNWKADSDLSRLNRAATGEWVSISSNLANLLRRAIEIGRETDNAFNIGVGDLVSAWGFGPDSAPQLSLRREGPRVCPPVEELLVVDAPGCRARKCGPVTLDLCGIAKGFGVDELARVLDEREAASWLVGIDGEMRSRGGKPDGTAWAIALEAPESERRQAMSVVELRDAAIATSGDYRRSIMIDGERISHTMDPRRGIPLQGTLASVTVISALCADADAYATALMVLGVEAGFEQARRLGIHACFVARVGDGIHVTGTGFFGSTQ